MPHFREEQTTTEPKGRSGPPVVLSLLVALTFAWHIELVRTIVRPFHKGKVFCRRLETKSVVCIIPISLFTILACSNHGIIQNSATIFHSLFVRSRYKLTQHSKLLDENV